MKSLFLTVVLSLSTCSIFADTIKSQIHDIEPDMILLENGRVVFLDQGSSGLIQKTLIKKEDWVEIRTDDRNSLESIKSIRAPLSPTDEPLEKTAQYTPTNLSTSAEASSIFSKMRRNYQNESQCYNRAHIWAYEEYNRSGLQSMKLFMFFTRKYIRNYRYHWWFHVTPMTYVAGVPTTLDRRYTRAPLDIKTWTDVFIYSRRACPTVYKYTDYSQNQTVEDCFLIPVSMYYWQPRDILKYEQTGLEKTSFIRSEVNWAYDEAF